MARENVIETFGLTRDYGSVRAVDGLDLRIEEGEIFGFLGPNGAGKTTTLLMLLGLSRPTGGTARVCGLDPVREARRIKEQVGYLPENVGFYGELTAEESLEYVAALNAVDQRKARKSISEALQIVGLARDETRRKPVRTFSRGMRQRLGIAEVLIKDPRVLFLDEPTLGLDPDGALHIMGLIEVLNRERDITVLLSSHHLHQVQRISDRVGIMIQGRMQAQGSVKELAEKTHLSGEHGEGEVSLEAVYMQLFQEAQP